MLINFSVENYLSFKELTTFSMLTAPSVKELNSHTISFKKQNILKTSAIYGANASGKSNIIKAMRFMRNFVLSSSKDGQAGDKIDVERFRLSNETDNKPCFFEIIFVHNEIKYRYGFTTNQERIYEEWLFQTEKSKESELFYRDKDGVINIGTKFRKAEIFKTIIRNNALFLSVTAQFNINISVSILEWFNKNFIILTTDIIGFNLGEILEEKLNNYIPNKDLINGFLKFADVGINDISVEKSEYDSNFLSLLNESGKKVFLKEKSNRILTKHNKYDSDYNIISDEIFDLYKNESDGTKKFLGLVMYIIDSISNNNVLIIDEMDSRLHTLLTYSLVYLFNNSGELFKSQLIFSTHDTSLLNKEIFRRDQIWFVDKNNYGESKIFSLIEYKVRNDASFQKNYVNGRYGAIPNIGNFKSIIERFNES